MEDLIPQFTFQLLNSHIDCGYLLFGVDIEHFL